MSSLKQILIVDDNKIKRGIVRHMLENDYSIIEAKNGKEALSIIKRHPDEILAVLTDVLMPEMDGFKLIKEITTDEFTRNIPIIAMTAHNDDKEEVELLKLGAWDFISIPLNHHLLHMRLKNAIARSELELSKRMQYMCEYDDLTGIYSKYYFMSKTRFMLDDNPDKKFVFIYFDIDRFQVFNSFYGHREGERIIYSIAEYVKELSKSFSLIKYGKMEESAFCICMEWCEEGVLQLMKEIRNKISQFNENFEISPAFGLYVIENNAMSFDAINGNALLASRNISSDYMTYYAFYDAEMSNRLKAEQMMLNDMQKGIDRNEFKVYYQPKYNISSNKISGSEALVRWFHPFKGEILPGDFVPVFEKNGYISKLDYYIWENVCKTIRKWLDTGVKVLPVSVNVSRINIYNPKFVEYLIGLIEKYRIPLNLLELEITEGAYSNNASTLIEIVHRLKEYGFTILMDDFGSGYSSLSILKDIEVDILKVDMNFLSSASDSGRGENIIASIIHMAKWLKVPVIVEGVESYSQVTFLRTVGCDFVQGFFYSEPLPLVQFEELMKRDAVFDSKKLNDKNDDFDLDTLFQTNPQMKVLFGDLLHALAIFEYNGDNIEFVRVNEGYYDVFGSDDKGIKSGTPIDYINEKYQKTVIDSFKLAVSTKGTAECDFLRTMVDGSEVWVNLKLRYIKDIGGNYILLGILDDITARKKIDFEMEKYRKAVIGQDLSENVMLIVDDVAVNRTILRKIFQDQYKIIEASDGMEALEILNDNPRISLILLDIVMPRMNGWEFLEHKKMNESISKIPVIVITSEDKYEEQVNALDLGTKDYILKPFVPDLVRKRVANVMNSIRFVDEMMKKYDHASKLSRLDKLTGLYNRVSAEENINKYLEENGDEKHALLIFDIDNFEDINQLHGSAFGDEILKKSGVTLRKMFRGDDIIFRYGGDIFGVFAKNFKNEEMIMERCRQFNEEMRNFSKFEECTCTIGIVFSSKKNNSFIKLFDSVEARLFRHNSHEKGRCFIYN